MINLFNEMSMAECGRRVAITGSRFFYTNLFLFNLALLFILVNMMVICIVTWLGLLLL